MTGKAGGPDTESETGPEKEPPRAVQTVFLERQSYRRRRLVDLARLLPLLGVVLLLVPLLWPESDASAVASGRIEAMPMSRAITYIFAVWALLIGGAVLFAIGARRWGGDAQRGRDPQRSEPERD